MHAMRYAVLFLLDLAVLVVALIDCLSSDESDIRALPRIWWVLLILLFSPIGGIAWFIAGRPQRSVSKAKTWHPGSGVPESERPRDLAPDDNPEFLRRIARSKKDDDELMRRWEEDLRRREEELRRRDSGDGNGPAPKES